VESAVSSEEDVGVVGSGSTGGEASARAGLTVALFTAVVWIGCSLVGWLGAAFPEPRPRPPTAEPPPLVIERVEVELGEGSATAPTTGPVQGQAQGPASDASDLGAPPPLGAPAPPPARPSLQAVAPPSAAVDFPQPSAGAPVASAAEAGGGVAAGAEGAGGGQGGTGPASTSGSSGQGSPGAGVQTLVFGVGEGMQPAAEYPPKALRDGQEGAVLVRLRVSESGRVVSAQLARPSAWPLLNAAALRVVKDRWSFRPGPVRVYEVSIRFQLSDEG
jgi:TonB family protein